MTKRQITKSTKKPGGNNLLQLMPGFPVRQHVVNEMFGGLGQWVGVIREEAETVDDLLDVAQIRQNW